MQTFTRTNRASVRPLRWVLAGFLIFGLAACDDDETTAPEIPTSVAAVVSGSSSLGTLTAALESAGLVGALEGQGPFTIFAPRNAAFDALGADVVSSLLESGNADLLETILTYHVVPGASLMAGDLSDGQTVTTLQGEELTIGVSGGSVTVDGAAVVEADLESENGVVHVIDAVLVPSETDLVDVAVLNGFSTLVGLVRDAGLESTLRSDNGGAGFTVFAPTNDAFAALSTVPSGQALVDVLTYHVVGATVGSGDLSDGQVVTTVQGGTFTVNLDGSAVSITDGAGNTVDVTLTDVPASNGVIHVLSGVLLPS